MWFKVCSKVTDGLRNIIVEGIIEGKMYQEDRKESLTQMMQDVKYDNLSADEKVGNRYVENSWNLKCRPKPIKPLKTE